MMNAGHVVAGHDDDMMVVTANWRDSQVGKGRGTRDEGKTRAPTRRLRHSSDWDTGGDDRDAVVLAPSTSSYSCARALCSKPPFQKLTNRQRD